MKINRSRQFKINLANYESYSFGASVSVDHKDFGHSDEDVIDLSDDAQEILVNQMNVYCNVMLAEIMKEEILAADAMTDEKKSIVKHLVTAFGQPTNPPTKKD